MPPARFADAAVHMTGAAAAAPAPVGLRSWWMVAVLFILYVFSWLDRLTLSMLVGPIKADLVLSDFQMSLLLGPAFAIFYALFGLPLGWAADRHSRRWVIFIGVSLWAVATCASGFARTFHELLLARMGVGIGEASLMPAAYSLLADEFPRERLTLAASAFQMAGKIGSATAFGLGAIAIAFAQGMHGIDWPALGHAHAWQLVLIMVGLPGFALALLVFTFREPPRRNLAGATGAAGAAGRTVAGAAAGAERRQFRDFVRSRWQLVSLMLVSFSSLAICGYTQTSWVPTYLSRSFHWAPVQYGPALSLMNLVAAASLLVSGRIVDHLYARGMRDAHLRYYSWLMLAVAPAAVGLFLTRNAYVFLGLYCVVQFVTVPFMIYVSSIIALLAPNAIRGQLIAAFLFAFTLLGLGAGPAMVGALTDYLFADESRIGTSMMIVVVGFYALAFVTMRMGLSYLAPAVREADAARSAA
jgi:MFS family permease